MKILEGGDVTDDNGQANGTDTETLTTEHALEQRQSLEPPAPARKRKRKEETPPREAPRDDPPGFGGFTQGPGGELPPFATGGDQAAKGLTVKISRKLLPAGVRLHPSDKGRMLGNAGFFPSHDLREILDHVETTWGGGTYQIDYFRDGVQLPKTSREESIPGDPLPLREEVEDYEPYEPQRGYGRAFGGRFGVAAEDAYQYPPGVVPTPAWTPPRGAAETDELKSLRERLAKAEREAERVAHEKREAEREARWQAQIAALQKPVVDPMGPFMQMMAEQAKQQAARQERDERDARERREREERDRAAREEKEEQRRREEREKEMERRREEREEAAKREEREDRLRREERKDREQREERLAKEQREFMTAMAAANSPDKMITMMASLQKLTAPASDPVEQLIRLKEAEGILKDDGGDDEKEGIAEKVAGTLNSAAAAAAAYFEGRKGAAQPTDIGQLQQVQPSAHQPPQQLPQRQRRPQPEISQEAQVGRAMILFKFAVEQQKGGTAPGDAALALIGYAKGLEEQHPGITANLLELSGFAAMPQDQVVALIAGLSTTVTNQTHAGYARDVSAMVADPAGFAWIQQLMAAVQEAVGA